MWVAIPVLAIAAIKVPQSRHSIAVLAGLLYLMRQAFILARSKDAVLGGLFRATSATRDTCIDYRFAPGRSEEAEMNRLDPYIELPAAFVERGELDGLAFQTRFLELFKGDETMFPDEEFLVLDKLFWRH